MTVKLGINDYQIQRLIGKAKLDIMDTEMSPAGYEKIWSPATESAEKLSTLLSMRNLDRDSKEHLLKNSLDKIHNLSINKHKSAENNEKNGPDPKTSSGRLSFSVDSLLSTISQSKPVEEPDIAKDKPESDEELDVEDSDDYVDDEDEDEDGANTPSELHSRSYPNYRDSTDPHNPNVPPFLAALFATVAASSSGQPGAPLRPTPNWPHIPGVGYHPGFHGLPNLHHPLFKSGKDL